MITWKGEDGNWEAVEIENIYSDEVKFLDENQLFNFISLRRCHNYPRKCRPIQGCCILADIDAD